MLMVIGLLSLGAAVLGAVLGIVACVNVFRKLPWIIGIEACYEQHQIRTPSIGAI